MLGILGAITVGRWLAMARKSSDVDDADSLAVLLRTSADVASHSLSQIDVLASKWPEFASDATSMREFVERLVTKAKDYGYIEKRGRV